MDGSRAAAAAETGTTYDPAVVVPALVAGGGPAGLAVSACLQARGVAHVVVDRHERIAESWRRHYDRLHLHTHRRSSALPGMPWPVGAPAYPSRDDVVAYLETYAARLRTAPRLGVTVRDARREGGAWRIGTTDGTYRARHLVLATGLNDEPVRPAWPGLDAFPGTVVHSSEYRNGAPFRGRSVLVVGFGNSGAEIAVDLVEHDARVAMAVRSPVNVVPRRVAGLPVEQVGRLLDRVPAVARPIGAAVQRLRYGDLEAHGLRLASEAPTARIHAAGRLPVIDIGTADLIRRGVVRIRPGVEAVEEGCVRFADGAVEAFDALVLATGYRPGYPSFLEGAPEVGPADPPPSGPDLHAVGLRVTVGGTLRLIAEEAELVAARIAAAPGAGHVA